MYLLECRYCHQLSRMAFHEFPQVFLHDMYNMLQLFGGIPKNERESYQSLLELTKAFRPF